jgi:hypothetical protein
MWPPHPTPSDTPTHQRFPPQGFLDPCDTYTLRFWKVTITRKKPSKDVSYDLTECQLVSSHSSVYCDMLHDLIEQETGLYARF